MKTKLTSFVSLVYPTIASLGLLKGISLIAWNVTLQQSQRKIGYVNINEVFEKFDAKNERQAQLEANERKRRSELDSLYRGLQALEVKAGEGGGQAVLASLDKKRETFALINQSYKEKFAEEDKKYTSEILTKINQYVKEFAKANDYDYILGTNGSGVIMHAPDTDNVTQLFLEFANKKYHGKS
jgi:outer membrane protein